MSKDINPPLLERMPWIFGAIFALAFLVRFVFICQWFTTPYGQMPYLDAHMYDLWARNIANGQWLRDKAFYQTPLFPYVLAGLYSLFGSSAWIVALFNAVIGSFTCVFSSLTAARCFGGRAAILTGVLAALYRPYIFYTAPILKETLELFLLSGFLLIFLRALDTSRVSSLIWSGIWLGLSILARGNLLLLTVPAGLLVFRRTKPDGLKKAGIFLSAVVLSIAPATLHNAWVSHDFVPLVYSGGFNFFIGNRVGADGANAYPTEVATGPGEEASITAKAVAAAGHALKPSEISSYWTDRAIDFIALHPFDTSLLVIRKTALFFSNAEIPDNYNVDFFARQMETLLSAPLPSFALVLGLVVFASLASVSGKRRELGALLILAGTYLISVIPFYVTDRYRLPILIFLLPAAGLAAPAIRPFVKSKNWGKLAGLEMAAVTVALLSLSFPASSNTGDSIGWAGLSDIDFKVGRDEDGLSHLQKAIDLSRPDVGAYFYMNGVFAEDRMGRHAEAVRLLIEGADLHPTEAPVMDESYGRFMLDRAKATDALLAFRAAVKIDPGYAAGYAGMARASSQLGERQNALDYAHRALTLDPANLEDMKLIETLAHQRR